MGKERIPWIVLLLAALLLMGCTTTRTVTKEVPVEVPVIRHDTVVMKQAAKELVKIKDSIVRMNDTLKFYHKTVIDRSSRDTVYLSKTDTVFKPKYITKTVEKKAAISYKWFFMVGLIVMLLGIGLLRYKVWKSLKPPNK